MRNTIAVMTSELPQRKVFCVRIVKCDYLWSRDYERICVHGGVSYDWVSVLLNLSATEGRAEPRKERLVWPPLLMIDSQVQWSIIPPSYYVFSFIQPTIYLPCSRTRDWFLNLRVISMWVLLGLVLHVLQLLPIRCTQRDLCCIDGVPTTIGLKNGPRMIQLWLL